jgi:hypothetical protein
MRAKGEIEVDVGSAVVGGARSLAEALRKAEQLLAEY